MTPEMQALLKKQEDLRLTMYRDSLGYPTIGYGHLLSQPIPEEAADIIFQHDVALVEENLRAYSWYNGLDDFRKDIIANMAFNMGIVRLLSFHHMIAYLQIGDFEGAAIEMENSKWDEEVGFRATVLARMMKEGKWDQS